MQKNGVNIVIGIMLASYRSILYKRTGTTMFMCHSIPVSINTIITSKVMILIMCIITIATSLIMMTMIIMDEGKASCMIVTITKEKVRRIVNAVIGAIDKKI